MSSFQVSLFCGHWVLQPSTLSLNDPNNKWHFEIQTNHIMVKLIDKGDKVFVKWVT